MARDPTSLVYLPSVFTGRGSSYTPIAIAEHLAVPGERLALFVPSAVAPVPPVFDCRFGVPPFLPHPFRSGRFHQAALSRIERKLIRTVRKRGGQCLIWLWPGASVSCVEELSAAGATIVCEMINTHQETARRILDKEAARIGVSGIHTITDQSISAENAVLEMAHVIVSPSDCVDASLKEWGVPAQKVLPSYFGWDPARFSDPIPKRGADKFIALFVGEVSVRKGAHLALEAWARAGIDGELRFVGRIHPAMQPIFDRYGANRSITHVPHTDTIAQHYQTADVLIFPTLEEGAPLVCYEAMGCGLPVITSAMGSARIVRHGENGMIVDPYDTHALSAALCSIADDAYLRANMRDAARKTASSHRWVDAAQDRVWKLKALLDGPVGRGSGPIDRLLARNRPGAEKS